MAPFYKIPLSSMKPDQLPNLMKNLELLEDLFAGRIDTVNLADNAVTTVKIASAAVTTAKIADKVGRTESGQYTGDGTANREINVSFRARYVWVIRHDTSMVFESVGDATQAFVAGRRTSAGAWTGSGANDADWQGVSANGFKLGSDAAGGLSNASGQTYTYFAVK